MFLMAPMYFTLFPLTGCTVVSKALPQLGRINDHYAGKCPGNGSLCSERTQSLPKGIKVTTAVPVVVL